MGVRIFPSGGGSSSPSFYYYNAMITSSAGVLSFDYQQSSFPSAITWQNKDTGIWGLTFADASNWDLENVMVSSNYADTSDLRAMTFVNLDYINTTLAELRLASFENGIRTVPPILVDDFSYVLVTIIQFIP